MTDYIIFVEWMFKITGWRRVNGKLVFPGCSENDPEENIESLIYMPAWEKIWKPRLLQLAIEGVNSQKSEYTITQSWGCINILKDSHLISHYTFFRDTINKAKESALKHIYE